jgi:dCTP deaminase
MTSVTPPPDDSGVQFDVFLVPQPIDSFTYQSEEDLLKEIGFYEFNKLRNTHALGTMAYRELTVREKANFNPMISPFVDGQVRERWIRPNEEQRRKWQASFDGSVDFDIKEKWRSTDLSLGLEIAEKIVSYGLSSFGYDIRCSDEFKIFTNINSTVVDPKNFDDKNFVNFKGPICIIPPNSFVLTHTLERFIIPRDIVSNCVGKSTYARCGISVMVTPLEPEWEGYLTLEFANATPLPAMLYANEGCAQIQFFRGTRPCEVSYKDRGGKYQSQIAEPVTPKV